MKRELLAALAVGGMLAVTANLHPANAIPAAGVSQGSAPVAGMVTPIARGGHPHGGGGRGMMRGPGMGARMYGGPRHRGWAGGGGWNGGRGHHHHYGGGPRFRGYLPYYGYYPYYDDYAFSDFDDCSVLRRRALATGSRVWWNRYYACIDG
jgi:hypothetical protein